MKEKNEGCRSVAAGSGGLWRALCLCGLIASMSLFEVLTASVSGCQPIVVSVYEKVVLASHTFLYLRHTF